MDPAKKEALIRLGLESAMKTLEKSAAVPDLILQAAEAANISSASPTVGALLLAAATDIKEADKTALRAFVFSYIASERLLNKAQVTAACAYLKAAKVSAAGDINVAEFDRACGAGVRFSDEEIRGRVREVLGRHAEELRTARYTFPIMDVLREMKEGDGGWGWADGGKMKAALDAEVLELLGPKNADDEKMIADIFAAKKAAAKEKDKAAAAGAGAGGKGTAAVAGAGAGSAVSPAATPAASPAPGAGAAATASGEPSSPFVARELTSAINSPALLEEHRRVTGGKIRTRFPPEPNGFLHVGHAKSMNLNFEGAFLALGKDPKTDGETIFRYDDTNPEKESPVYIKSQADNVAWLGWKPVRVTHSSDYFEQLYDFAVALIRKGRAFVCHQSKEEMEASREIAKARDGRDPNSPWRDRPVEESLREFEAMRHGKYPEGGATLRLKVDMAHANPTLWDPIAYRIKYCAHPMTGDAWCIYPSYDFSHCIIDSLEHIDYSLCTLEFEIRRDIYYWVLEQLDLYRPYVWEFSRLNLQYVMLSKRNILKLVTENKVRGWDDPRLATINGLRRRGYTPEAINAFCRDIGVSRSENIIMTSRLEFHLREHLDVIAKRAFAVLRPLKVTLLDFPEGEVRWLEAPDFPRDKALGSHRIALSRVVYIEQDDFRLVDDKNYYGLAPGKVAGLRYAGFVKVVDVVKDDAGKPIELRCEYDHDRSRTTGKVKGNLHWVSSSVPGAEPATAEVRLYDQLFTTESPGSTGDWESEINPNSETVLTGCYVDASLVAPGAVAVRQSFQFERMGFFVVDQDSDLSTSPPRLVFNQTVSLKEDTTTKKVRATA